MHKFKVVSARATFAPFFTFRASEAVIQLRAKLPSLAPWHLKEGWYVEERLKNRDSECIGVSEEGDIITIYRIAS